MARAQFEEALAISRDLKSTDGIAWALVGMAETWTRRGQPTRAARLLGAAEAQRERANFALQSFFRRQYERVLTAVHTSLDEPTLAVAWKAGRAMSLDEAVALAIDQSAPAGG